jgi:hypothetical protein
MMKRFVIDTNNQAVIDAINEWQISNPEKRIKPLLTLISEYDREKFQDQLNKIQEALRTLRDNKIDEDIMLAYIKSKGVPASTVRQVLDAQKLFFKKLGLI